MGERRHSDARLITVVETREFQHRAATRVSEVERQAFITFCEDLWNTTHV